MARKASEITSRIGQLTHHHRTRYSGVLAAGAVAVTAAGLLAAAAAPAGATVGPARASAARWVEIKTITNRNFPAFSAIAATGAHQAWAFETQANARPAAWHLSGSAWGTKPFPEPTTTSVQSAVATSASDAWAFTTFRVIHWNGASWKVSHVFPDHGNTPPTIAGGTATSSTNAYAFLFSFNGPDRTWHYNGHSWSRDPAADGVFAASSLSGRSIWAISQFTVRHYNGTRWTSTSLKSLLPKPSELCPSGLTAIYAVSSRNIWATGSGECEDEGGPLVLLHDNGSRWSKVTLHHRYGSASQVVPDGSGGLWLVIAGASGANSAVLHYAHGTLSQVKLPISQRHYFVDGATFGGGSVFLVGTAFGSETSSLATAFVLRYGG
jgi:hypothetical protein